MRHKHNYQLLVETRQKHPVTGKLWMIRVDVDVAGLVQMMAESAMNAKGGEARACYGDVRVRATSVEEAIRKEQRNG